MDLARDLGDGLLATHRKTAASVLLSLLVLAGGSGCNVPYRAGMVVAEEMRAPLSASIAAAGILDRRGGHSQNAGAHPSGARWIASVLSIPNVGDQISDQELALLEAPPAYLQLNANRLLVLSERLGTRYLVSGTAGLESVDIEKRWVILVLIPVVYTIITIPIPVTYGKEPGLPRAALTTRVVDLERAEVIGASIEVQTGEASEAKFDRSHVTESLKSIGLTRKYLR